MATSLHSIHKWYYDNFLNTNTGLDLNNLWLVSISTQEDETEFLNVLKKEAARFDYKASSVNDKGVVNGWESKTLSQMVDATWNANLKVVPDDVNIIGWSSKNILANAFQAKIPQEQLATKTVDFGPGYTWVPPILADKHKQFEPLTLTFYYSAYPFSEFIVRPWLMATNRYGLKLRTTRADIVCTLFTKKNPLEKGSTNWYPKFQYKFFACYPLNIPNVDLSYDDDGLTKSAAVQFGYDFYRMGIPDTRYTSPLPTEETSITQAEFARELRGIEIEEWQTDDEPEEPKAIEVEDFISDDEPNAPTVELLNPEPEPDSDEIDNLFLKDAIIIETQEKLPSQGPNGDELQEMDTTISTPNPDEPLAVRYNDIMVPYKNSDEPWAIKTYDVRPNTLKMFDEGLLSYASSWITNLLTFVDQDDEAHGARTLFSGVGKDEPNGGRAVGEYVQYDEPRLRGINEPIVPLDEPSEGDLNLVGISKDEPDLVDVPNGIIGVDEPSNGKISLVGVVNDEPTNAKSALLGINVDEPNGLHNSDAENVEDEPKNLDSIGVSIDDDEPRNTLQRNVAIAEDDGANGAINQSNADADEPNTSKFSQINVPQDEAESVKSNGKKVKGDEPTTAEAQNVSIVKGTAYFDIKEKGIDFDEVELKSVGEITPEAKAISVGIDEIKIDDWLNRVHKLQFKADGYIP